MLVYPVVYNHDLQRIAVLQNAFGVGYSKKLNSLWTAQFSLPANDPKNAECLPLRFVEIFDGNERVELFRILPTNVVRDDSKEVINYQLEHVLATLLGDVLFRHHQTGGTGVFTPEILTYILARQAAGRWRLGTVAFARQLEYKWENESLLAALFSVTKPFDQEHVWTWDTTSYPWTLNLTAPPTAHGPEIRYRKNLRGVEREEDPTNLSTRLYVLGYGEGVNQLGIEAVNPTGLPYIDASTQAQYGVISRVWVDRRFEDAASLFASAVAALEEMKLPRISVSAAAADLYQISNDPLEKFALGQSVRVYDDELGIDYTSRVVALSKADVFGDPGGLRIEIANAPLDLAGSIADLANRARINEVYAQGATTLDSYTLSDNCDAQNPARFRFHIPAEAVNINKALLNFQTSAFRSYSRAIAGGGAHADTVVAGGAFGSTTPSAGEHRHRMFLWTGGHPWQVFTTWQSQFSGLHQHDSAGSHDHGGATRPASGHTHEIWAHGLHQHASTGHHSHDFHIPTLLSWDCQDVNGRWQSAGLGIAAGANADIWTFESAGMHSHNYDVPNHSHSYSIPSHVHDIEHGIFLGPAPTSITLRVDGNIVPGLGLSVTEVNILPHLAKDAGGRVVRGWHELMITPNALGRVEATLHLQLFVASRGEVTL